MDQRGQSGHNDDCGGGYGYKTTFSLSGFLLNTVRINFNVGIDNAMTNVFLNAVAQNLNFTGFAALSSPFTLSSGFVNGLNTLEFGTENQGAGPGAFRAVVSGSGLAANTNSPLPSGLSTYYFRNTFNFSGNPNYSTLQINPVVADGAVFYLNGVEVYRQNMPAGPITYSTPALADVSAVNYSGPITIPATNLSLARTCSRWKCIRRLEVRMARSSGRTCRMCLCPFRPRRSRSMNCRLPRMARSGWN